MGLFCPKVNCELHGECLVVCMVSEFACWLRLVLAYGVMFWPRVCMDLVSSFHVLHVEFVNVH